MPNKQNVSAPVTLIAPARSGTPWLQRMIANHPEFAGAGNTASIVFGSWYAVEWPRGVVRATKADGRELSVEEKATRVVHNTLLTLFRDGKPRWIHTPIGEPEVLRLVARKEGADAALDWYWNVMNHAFPDGSFYTLLRNPFDAALSQVDAMDSSTGQQPGGGEAGFWKSAARMATILTHPNSLVSHAVIYSDLIAEPDVALTKLFAEIDVPFDRRVLKPLERAQATEPGQEQTGPQATTSSNGWHKLNPDFVTPDIERAITGLWSKFGARFDVPEHFTARGIRFLDAAHATPSGVGSQDD